MITRLFSDRTFKEYKEKCGNKGLPVHCKTSDGSLHDGRVRADTEEEYLKAAREFKKDCETRVGNKKYRVKRFSTDQEILKAVLDDMMNEEKHVAEKYKDRPEKERKRSRRKYFDKKSQEQVERDNKRLDKKLRGMGIEEQADTSFKTPSRPAPGKAPKEVKEIIEEKVATKARKPINKKAIGIGAAGVLGTTGAIYGAKKYKDYLENKKLRKEYREKFGLDIKEDKKRRTYKKSLSIRSDRANSSL